MCNRGNWQSLGRVVIEFVDDAEGNEVDDSGDSSSEDDRDKRASPTGGVERQNVGRGSVEDKLYNELRQIVDDSPAEEADCILQGQDQCGQRLRQHARQLFHGNTEETTRTKLGDWLIFCKAVYVGIVPKVDEVQWPPQISEWEAFLVEARQKVSSYIRFKNVVGNVCGVANRYWSNKMHVPPAQIDPRLVYSSQHQRMLGMLKREHGVGVRQVAAITMHEARNGTHFGDHFSVRGVAGCAAFAMGCLMGGRRPRSLTGILLSHIELSVGLGLVNGKWVKVPDLMVTLHEEKFPDIQGHRISKDCPFGEQYEKTYRCSPAFWVYRLCVLRGVFREVDPIINSAVGQVLHIRPECLAYYLFCEVHPNYWIDTAPSRVATLGSWNEQLLQRMGCEPRKFSSHRSGFVSRTCILAILDARGKELPLDVIEVMVRWGGWQAVTRARTVLRVYARKILDQFVDPYALSLGFEASEAEWEKRKAEYLGSAIFPSQAIFDCGRSVAPLQVRMRAWQGRNWQNFQSALNDASAKMMRASFRDKDVMPMHRYRQARRAYNLYRKQHRGQQVVRSLEQLLRVRNATWKSCLEEAMLDCEKCFFEEKFVQEPHRYLHGQKFLELLEDMHIGEVQLNGCPVKKHAPQELGKFWWR